MESLLIHGDALTSLRNLPDDSVHCCVTSPPYFGLRSYLPDGHEDKGFEQGLESSPQEYVDKMVEVFREVRRVLRPDGTCWLNIGDSYAAKRGGTAMPAETLPGGVGGHGDEDSRRGRTATSKVSHRDCESFGLKHKDLIGIPWRVALALQADGWWLRQDIIFAKKSPMPESVTDRCTKAHEYVFLLTKSEKYFYDADAIREPSATAADGRGSTAERKAKGHPARYGMANRDAGRKWSMPPMGRNRRSVWAIATRPYKGAHFATMPPALAETCILGGTSERGCCPDCGSPWRRVTERRKLTRQRPNDYVKRTGEAGTGNSCSNSVAGVSVTTVGWEPSCKCGRTDAVPCVVLDPFAGSGTTLAVAASLGREGVGIELNEEYILLAKKRVAESVTLFA
jgi:DNA modification methylase